MHYAKHVGGGVQVTNRGKRVPVSGSYSSVFSLSKRDSHWVMPKKKCRHTIEQLPVFGFKLAPFLQSLFACSAHGPP